MITPGQLGFHAVLSKTPQLSSFCGDAVLSGRKLKKLPVRYAATPAGLPVSRFVVVRVQFNFVGRILGPRGMTAKQLEMDTGCKIMVRGKGSMRDKMKVGIPVF